MTAFQFICESRSPGVCEARILATPTVRHNLVAFPTKDSGADMARKPAADTPPSRPLAERLAETMAALEAQGSEQTRKTFLRHGLKGPQFGVKVADLKTILKTIKGDQALALALWDTGNSDARYLAGLLADAKKLTPETLQHWAETATWTMQSECSVAWNASESGHGWDLGRRWLEDPREMVATAGWHALIGHLALTPDADLDLPAISALLQSIPGRLPTAPNRARAAMNNFVIGVAGSVAPLLDEARAMAVRLGQVEVDVGDTSCVIPLATAYIDKLVAGGYVGRKRKTVKC
jgi:3-methyladenine DNA glycosylase AlkD